MPCHTIPHHTIPCHTIPYHTIPHYQVHYTILYDNTLHDTTPNTISPHPTPSHTTRPLHHITPQTTPYHTAKTQKKSRYHTAKAQYVKTSGVRPLPRMPSRRPTALSHTSCCAILQHATKHHTILQYIVSYYSILFTIPHNTIQFHITIPYHPYNIPLLRGTIVNRTKYSE